MSGTKAARGGGHGMDGDGCKCGDGWRWLEMVGDVRRGLEMCGDECDACDIATYHLVIDLFWRNLHSFVVYSSRPQSVSL